MYIILPKFRSVVKQWLVTRPPSIVSLFANKSCEFWVQVQYFNGHMVLGRVWEYFCSRHKIVPDELVVFRIFDLGLKVEIFNANSSNIYRVWCSKHNCIGDIAHAM
ncbi:hypothetical protein D1007_59075 [Hordeum vulgare]|nr:hypothetical protein D1007_59075 [Hordeum vulgare]